MKLVQRSCSISWGWMQPSSLSYGPIPTFDSVLITCLLARYVSCLPETTYYLQCHQPLASHGWIRFPSKATQTSCALLLFEKATSGWICIKQSLWTNQLQTCITNSLLAGWWAILSMKPVPIPFCSVRRARDRWA
jgi:hypothetical protein